MFIEKLQQASSDHRILHKLCQYHPRFTQQQLIAAIFAEMATDLMTMVTVLLPCMKALKASMLNSNMLTQADSPW